MDKKKAYETLLNQINLTSDSSLQTGQFKKVVVNDDKREWQFHLHFPDMLPFESFQMLKQRIETSFKDIARVKLIVTTDNHQRERVMAYINACVEQTSINDHLKQQILSTHKAIDGNRLIIHVADDIQGSYFKTALNGQLIDALHDCGVIVDTIDYEVDLTQSTEIDDAVKADISEEAALIRSTHLEHIENKKNAPKDDVVDKQIGKFIDFDGVRPLHNIVDEEYNVKVEGVIFSKRVIVTRTKKHILNMNISDYTDSITCKAFSRNGKNDEAVFEQLSEGDWVIVEGNIEYDTFQNEIVLNIRNLRVVKKKLKTDNSEVKRIELHAHTAMSQMDAIPSAKELINRARQFGHPAVAITDHNNLQSFPQAYNALDPDKVRDGTEIKVLYGLEGLLVNDGAPITYQPTDANLQDATYVVFDVETTGLSSKYDKIIELAAAKIVNGEIIDEFSTFVNPHQKLSQTIINLTKIEDHDLKDAPELETVIKEFKEFVGDAIFVAHNASFDMGFIQAAYRLHDLGEYKNSVIDTLELSRTINTESKKHGLNTLAKKYNVDLEQHHRAIYDTRATAYIFIKMLRQLRDLNIHNLQDIDAELSNDDAYKRAMPTHVNILVQTQVGLKNLFKLVSASLTDYYYRTPRIPKKLLSKYREGLLIGSSCDNGELFTAVMQKTYAEAKEIAKFYDYIEVFPKELYLRLLDREIIHDEAMLEDIINNLIKIGKELDIPVVATGNVHYLDDWDKQSRDILVKSNPGNPLSRGRLPDAHFRTTDEMLRSFSFLDEDMARTIVIDNTHKIANSIERIEVIKDGLYPPKMDGADEEVREICYRNAHALYGPELPEKVVDRLEFELNNIITNNFSVIYLISQKLVKKSLDDGYLVGSRGSVGSSFVATMLEITEVNPLPPHYICSECHKVEFFTDGAVSSGYDLPDSMCDSCGIALIKEGQDIPFETFLGFKGDKTPDIDLNFSGEYQAIAHQYTKEIFGEEKVFRAGTIGTVAEKTAFGYVKGYINDNGLQKRNAEVERLVLGCSGVKRTTGQHPGGIIVVPDDYDIYDFTPVQFPADDTEAEWKTTHFDFHSIDDNLLKLDILGHDDPTMIRMLHELSGIDPKTIPVDDKDTMRLFSSPESLGVTPEDILCKTGTLGVPEFGTSFVRQMLEDTRPSTFSELVQISGLSHGTDVWLNNAQDLVRKGIVELKDVIGCRDDIMVQLMYDGLEPIEAFNIMERVRKGRQLTPEQEVLMRQNNVPEWYIDSCNKIKYMFPKAHAAAYVLMAVRIAYFKVHYPLFYYASYFTIRASDFDLLTMVRDKEDIRATVQELNERERLNDLSKKEKDTLVVLELVNEMAHRGYNVQPVHLTKSKSFEFVIEGDSLIPPFISVPGLGASVARRIVDAREDEMFLSKEDLQKRGGVSQKIIDYLTELRTLDGLPDKAQLSLFDL